MVSQIPGHSRGSPKRGETKVPAMNQLNAGGGVKRRLVHMRGQKGLTVSNLSTQKSAREVKPRALWIAILIAAAQVYRVLPILILPPGFLPSYLFPNEVGDFLVGITALPVALALRRAGLLGWAISAVWFALGIGDIVQAAGVAALNGGQSMLPIFVLAFVLETSGLVQLLGGKTRDYVAYSN